MGQYDEDYQDDAQRCIHGTFIGSWWGPDYLCQYCEDGTTIEEFEAIGHYHVISANCKAEGHNFDFALRCIWEACPNLRQDVLNLLAGGTWHGLNGAHYYDAWLYEELAIAKANLGLARLGLEQVK